MRSPSAPPLPLPLLPRTVAQERWPLHLLLFLLTLACVTGLQILGDGASLSAGLSFAATLLGILTCHELGHYVAGRRHGVSISLPFFIPVPLGIGTFGAVIRIREPIPHRNALVDIGVAGPLAGVAAAVPLLLFGIARSHYEKVGYDPGLHLPGPQSLLALAGALHHGFTESVGTLPVRASAALSALGAHLSPAHPLGWSGDSLLTWGAQALLLGPSPAGTDLVLHPVAAAAWWGLLITLLNLLPIGQLDGGHLAHALLGPRARTLGQLVHLGMVLLLCFGSVMWIAWLLLTRYLVGLEHPPVSHPGPALSTGRLSLCALALVILVLVFMPVPFEVRGAAP
jgi:membrane-associated protease RseP (regulator of RpoE activity)